MSRRPGFQGIRDRTRSNRLILSQGGFSEGMLDWHYLSGVSAMDTTMQFDGPRGVSLFWASSVRDLLRPFYNH